MSELEQQVFEFMIGSMKGVSFWYIRLNHACQVRNPQNRGNPPIPCKHCVDIDEHTEITYLGAKGPPKDIIKTWICPRVIEAHDGYEGNTILCLDCVLEAAKSIVERKESREMPVGGKIQMKIIIEYSQTKRVIEGPFNICGSAKDLLKLAKCIADKVDGGFGYGWVQIPVIQPSIANTPPKKWDEKEDA